ncbi:hypothetical protein Ddc_01108 [Ditylenchus destructor]|nr:hypothetical protein Ddc_01108 [Ditylenchus destructor]
MQMYRVTIGAGVCKLCQDYLDKDNQNWDNVAILNCGHVFHSNCLRYGYKINRGCYRCIICDFKQKKTHLKLMLDNRPSTIKKPVVRQISRQSSKVVTNDVMDMDKSFVNHARNKSMADNARRAIEATAVNKYTGVGTLKTSIPSQRDRSPIITLPIEVDSIDDGTTSDLSLSYSLFSSSSDSPSSKKPTVNSDVEEEIDTQNDAEKPSTSLSYIRVMSIATAQKDGSILKPTSALQEKEGTISEPKEHKLQTTKQTHLLSRAHLRPVQRFDSNRTAGNGSASAKHFSNALVDSRFINRPFPRVSETLFTSQAEMNLAEETDINE